MQNLIEMTILLPLLVVLYQFYKYAIKRIGVEKQKSCQLLGIVYCTLGITSLAIHSPFFVFTGLLLLMFGLRLIAHGLDRINKSVFIDRYDDDK